MVDLPGVPIEVTESQAPRSQVSPGEVAQPWRDLGNALDQAGQGLEKVAEPLAERAGLQAVTTDANGNVKVDHWPIVGQAGVEYARAMKFAAVAEGEGEAKRQDIAIRQKFRDDPQGYINAADAFKNSLVKQYTDAAGPEVGLTMGKLIDAQTTLTYRGLLNEKERLDLSRANDAMNAGIARAQDAMVALANQGITSGPEWDRYNGQIKALYNEKVSNPRLAFPKEMASYELDKFHSELQVAAVRHHADEIEQSQGPDAALDYAKQILTDKSLTLNDVDRRRAFDEARGVVRLNEYERRQSVQDINSDFKLLREQHADTGELDPAQITKLHQRYMDARDPAGAATVTQFGAVAATTKVFGNLPLPEQQQQIDDLKGRLTAGTAPEGAAATVRAAEAQTKRITEGLKIDGWSFFAARFPDRVERPPPLDFSNPDALKQGIEARGKIAALATQVYQSDTVPALNAAEIAQARSVLASPDLEKKAALFGALSGLSETTRNATLSALGQKSKADMVQAYGGSLMASQPDLGLSIMKGATLGDEYRPKEGQAKTDFQVSMISHMPPSAVAPEFRGQQFEMLRGAVEARYADLSQSADDTSGKFDSARAERAIQDVTGGMVVHNGQKIFAPKPGMTQGQFDGIMRGLTDDDLRSVAGVSAKGVTTPGGERISADYVRQNAHLESVGQGKYFIRLNKDSDRPLYAYSMPEQSGIGPPMPPRKFILDLNGREPAPPPKAEMLPIQNP